MDRSRLSRRYESKTKQSIALTILGFVIILGLILKFGIPFLAEASFTLFHKNDTDQPAIKSGITFVSPPELNALPTATNSAQITISGTAQGKQEIKLYINGDMQDTTDVIDDTFAFKNVSLKEGDNLIQTKAIEKDSQGKDTESAYSNSFTITFTKKTPTLSIDSPSDKQTFGKDDKFANVQGKTDPGNKVTVNDFWAIVDNSGGYSYSLPLKAGDNKITVKATDDANNTTEKDITVTYNP